MGRVYHKPPSTIRKEDTLPPPPGAPARKKVATDKRRQTSGKKDKIWVCGRCEITATKRGDTSCPCPRGGCEAEQIDVPQKMYTRDQIAKILYKTLSSDLNVTQIQHLVNKF